MFGIAAFSAAPFSSTAGSVYSESATIAASSSITSNAIRYAVTASATMSATSGLSCYSITYAFAGATIVGESDSDLNAVRYTFGSAQIDSSSFLTSASSVVLRTQAVIAGQSAFTSSCGYIAQPNITFACDSGFVANARKKWENEVDIAETWTTVNDQSEIWTPVTDTSEIWTTTH